MKKTLALLLCLVMVMSMTSCSLFTSEEGNGGASSGDIKITDEYTHKVPEGLEYETRYVYKSGETCSISTAIEEQYGAKATSHFIIVYADKNDVAVAQYTYIVMASEEDAKKYQAGYAEVTGTDKLQVDGKVTIQAFDQQELANSIDTYVAWSMLKSTSAKEYAKAMADMESLVEYIPE